MTASHSTLLWIGGGVECTSDQTAKEELQQFCMLIFLPIKRWERYAASLQSMSFNQSARIVQNDGDHDGIIEKNIYLCIR